MTIGEIATRSGSKVWTARYNELGGLLPEPDRTIGNYRSCSDAHLARLSSYLRACDVVPR